MIGVVLAAGVGSRLDRSETPKPLLKIGTKPMILRIIEQMQDAGIDRIAVVIGHRGEEIKKALTNVDSITALLSYIEQQDASKEGMLASILSLRQQPDDAFIITAADLIMEKNPFPAVCNATVPASSIGTLVETNPEQVMHSGALSYVRVSGDQVTAVGRTLETHEGVEVGVYRCTREALERLSGAAQTPPTQRFDETLGRLASDGGVVALRADMGEWFDVNTPATMVRAEMFMRAAYEHVQTRPEQQTLQDLPMFSQFIRSRLMQTAIVIERGLLQRLHDVRVIPRYATQSPHYLITDDVVDALYGDQVLNEFRKAGYTIRKIVVPAGEHTKNVHTYTQLAEELCSYGIDKHSFLISLGGGVVNNLAGFLASTIYRGIGLIHLPTSMMAQVDAALDFKQGVNSTNGKNLFGSYYPATSIFMDPNVLLTLDKRHLSNGISESLKHALTQDKTFLEYCLSAKDQLEKPEVLEHIVRGTVELKVPLLSGDVTDDYNEMIPQYGHSIGHALEHLSGYAFLHGEAIAIGMCISAEIAYLLGVCDHTVVAKHYEAFKAYQLPTTVPGTISTDDIWMTIRFDKHYLLKNPQMALVKEIGTMWHDKGIFGIPIDEVVFRRAIEANRRTAA